MSRYPTPPHSQTDSQSIGLSSYHQQKSLSSSQPAAAHSPSSSPAPNNEQLDAQIKRTARTHYDLLNSWLHNPSDQSNKSPPNRSNPRDKLTRLTRQQFQELSTDVYDELCRRIADSEEPQQPQNGAAPFLASRDEFHPKRNQARQKLASLPRSRFKDLASDVFYELERRYPEFLQPDHTIPSKQNYTTPVRNKLNQYNPDPQRPPPSLPSNPGRPLNPPMNAATGLITTDMVVPDKSTLVIENNDDAYDDQISGDVNSLEPPLRTASIDQPNSRDILKPPAPHDHRPRSGSLSSIKYLSHKRNESDSHLAFNRINSNGSKVSISEYDRQIATLQTKIITLEKELRETQLNSTRSTSNSARLEECEEEILHWKQQCEEQKHQIKTLQTSLQDEKKSKSKEYQSAEHEIQELKRQISHLNQRLESRPASDSNSRSNDSVVERLKAEVVELIDELRQMHSRQDLLLAEQDRFQETIQDLENTVELNKRRYEAAKTELRDLKRSSTIYAPKEFLPNEKLPLTQNGAIVDIHFTSYTASIDDLLRSGRSNVSNELISSVRRVIDTVSTIDEDIQQFELDPSMSGRLNLEEQESLDTMKTRINATLSNLITATKNHVVSLGLSPISLLDAAASHLSFSMVELVQLVGMRRATEAEIEMSENFHANRSKYDDDDSHQNGGAQITASKPRPANNGLSPSPNHTAGIGSLGRRNDDSPAPLRINKDRDRDSPRSQQGSGASPRADPYEQPGKLNGFLSRNRPPGALATNQPSSNGRNPTEKSPGGPLTSRTQQIASKFEELRSPSGFDGSNASDLRDSVSGSSSTNPDKVFDSPPRAGMLNRAFRNVPSIPIRHDLNGQAGRDRSNSRSARTETANSGDRSGEMSAQSDEEVEKLKVYLETQTESIVGSIQSLLSTIRGTAQVSAAATEEMDGNLSQIIKIVSAIVDRCSSSVSARPTDGKTQKILAELTENCQKLSQMQDGGFHNPTPGQLGFSKHVKQAMAAASFGVAKALKELNSHVSGAGEESLL
ncbi:hypothetical protein PtA15_1A900 [Puccinia triticina]|uniref:GIT Spa2 homology (SHD) domain-containing protein n=1 Tax=Puccinia triticina TaxID=208348 RepID=A0ABY7C9H4_9BASI|nr:uncharacterized protein PtA15_1A900 [Puccinia triticina]WAQ81558.1 hypothetical protein PtA15_1A900 [Puccinia triticina]